MRQAKSSVFILLAVFCLCAASSGLVHAQSDAPALRVALRAISPRDRVVSPVEDEERVTLQGNTLPQALPTYEDGAVEGDRKLDRLLLVLKSDPAQQAALDALVEAQQNPQSPLYRHWLTPESYARHFGISDADLEQVQAWLERNGLQVDEIAANHRTLTFSGTVAQVEAAFQTKFMTYRFGGQQHIANASDPRIPTALSAVVAGVASLHDVFSMPQHTAAKLKPEYSSGSTHYLSPADFAAIYDVTSLYSQAYTGAGESIAIVGRADISLSDVRGFRAQFGLPARDPAVTINGSNPGTAVSGDVDEAMLDVEWSGAVAEGATVDFVTTASTATSDGVFLSSQYVVNHNTAPVMSVSYGLCEADLGTSANAFFNSLWKQAAAEGITVLVSAGDSGAAGCDAPSESRATQGRGVNGLCSTPYSTCVGGTEFNDTANPSLYWNNTNSTTSESALGYIPESVWNESSSSGLWATGGGVSTVYPKPAWQSAPGVPADGKRDVPDVALTAAGHDAYLVEISGQMYLISGTSAASPSFAGIMALASQKAGARIGNANPELYHLAAAQAISGGAAVFHDIVAGNNGVPQVTGFSATAGYDQATGLGSVDAEKLVAAWGGGTSAPTPGLALSLSQATLALIKGGSATLKVTTAASGGFRGPVALSIAGLPAGLTAGFNPATIASPGSGNSILTLTASSTLAAGSSSLTIKASGDGLTETASTTASLPGFVLTAAPAASTLSRGSTLATALKIASAGGFNSPVALTASGLPSGVTAKFSSTTIASSGSGTLTLTAAANAALGNAKVIVSAAGGGLTESGTITFNLVAAGAQSLPPQRVPPN